jgi:hypothetical protein
VGAFRKSPWECDLNNESSSLLIRLLKSYTGFSLQQFTTIRQSKQQSKSKPTAAAITHGQSSITELALEIESRGTPGLTQEHSSEQRRLSTTEEKLERGATESLGLAAKSNFA